MENNLQLIYCPEDFGSNLEQTIPLPEGSYFFLRRTNGIRLPYIIGFLRNKENVLYVSLSDGQAWLWKDAISCEVLKRKVYSLPVRISSTSTISDAPFERCELQYFMLDNDTR